VFILHKVADEMVVACCMSIRVVVRMSFTSKILIFTVISVLIAVDDLHRFWCTVRCRKLPVVDVQVRQ
jgi:hypothetical protein